MATTGDLFWADDPSILISSKKMTQFFPHKSYTLNEKLNSLARLGMYCSLILIFYDKDIKWTSVFIFSLLFTFYLKHNTKTTTITTTPSVKTTTVKPIIESTQLPILVTPTSAPMTTTSVPMTTTSVPMTTTSVPMTTTSIPMTTTGAPMTTTSVPMTTTGAPMTTTSVPMTTTSVPMTTTSVPMTTTGAPMTDKPVVAINDFIEGLENTSLNGCVEPTLDNPFMNMTMKDYLHTDNIGNIIERQPACNPNDPEIKKKIDANFNNNLYRDVSDVFGKYNSQRQYFTMPWTQTIPDVDGNFKNWLYKTPKICKENNNCIKYEDLRARRQI